MSAAPRRIASRVNRAIAALLALWMAMGFVLVSEHQADAAHATLTDGTVVHVDAPAPTEAHAACREHSASQTLDQHTPPVAPAERCWVGDVAQLGLHDQQRFDRIVIAQARAAIAIAPRPALASASVLRFAPKTSPPVVIDPGLG